MDFSTIPVDFWVTLATIIATLFLGQLSKKFEIIEKKQIPLQNLCIGVIVCVIQFAITRDINTSVAISGLFSGGMYDLGKALLNVFSNGEE